MMGIRKRSARIAYMVNTYLLAIFLVIVLASGCANEQEILDENKATVVQLLVQHSQLREFLENKIYPLGGNVFITRYTVEDKSAVMFSDGKLIIPEGYYYDWYIVVKQNAPTIIAIFEEFNCESISLYYNGQGQRELVVAFDNIKIGRNHYYAQWLSYSRDGAVGAFENPESVFTDWYYSAPGYT
jgi:hypothetical protein